MHDSCICICGMKTMIMSLWHNIRTEYIWKQPRANALQNSNYCCNATVYINDESNGLMLM